MRSVRKEARERAVSAQLAEGKEICLTFRKSTCSHQSMESFIVVLSAREAVTLQQLRQTFVYQFTPAISILHLEMDDPFKEGSRTFSRLPSK